MYTTFQEYFEKTERPDLETVKIMKLRGCDDWNPAFEKVCQNGNMEMYKYFVDNLVDDDDSNYSGLCGSCEGGHMELVELYMDQTYDYYSGFVYACLGGHLDVIKLLYYKNPDVKKSDVFVMFGACNGGKIDAVNLLLGLGFDNVNQGLRGAAKGGYLDIVKLMIDKGANKIDTGLFQAACNGHLDMVKFFLGLGAEITPDLLRGACQSGDVELVKLCLELGNYNVNEGLVAACNCDRLEIVKWMIGLGADTNVLDWWQIANGGSSEVSRYLLQVYTSLFRNFECFRYTLDLDLYKIYLRHDGGFNESRYERLVSCQDPLYYIVINYSQQENKLIRMLPVDVWQMMMPFF